MNRTSANLPLTWAALALSLALGCSQSPSSPATAANGVDAATTAEDGDHRHTHDGWWCDEHGVPEELCGQCNAKVAAAFQRKGDWCRQHDRPDSQCFLCHPELEARFAAQYEARLGQKPPKPAG